MSIMFCGMLVPYEFIVFICSIDVVQSLRWTYYIYTLLPVVLWHQVFQR